MWSGLFIYGAYGFLFPWLARLGPRVPPRALVERHPAIPMLARRGFFKNSFGALSSLSQTKAYARKIDQ